MTPDEVLIITISIPMENGIKHTNSVTFPYDGDTYDVLAENGLREFLVLMENLWGELVAENLLNKKKEIVNYLFFWSSIKVLFIYHNKIIHFWNNC